MTTAANNLTTATNDRLQKAKNTWAKLRKTFITDTSRPIKCRLIISHAIVGSILLYSLHLLMLNKTDYSTIQSFYSECIRGIANGIKNSALIKFAKLINKFASTTTYPPYKADCIICKSTRTIRGNEHSLLHLNDQKPLAIR